MEESSFIWSLKWACDHSVYLQSSVCKEFHVVKWIISYSCDVVFVRDDTYSMRWVLIDGV